MSEKNLTRSDIASAIVSQIGVCGAEATELTELIIKEICNGLRTKKCFKSSSFGSFVVKAQATRTGRIIKTGNIVDIPARNTVLFKASVSLKNRMTKTHLKSNSNR
ncbi:HU family DNA-binding protein [Bartonella sp. TP]|uniref:HU family DNA-binding protein n=1 Tax=Bartonella sp. TP TaxID=3057550 RepID=UPI0025AF9521|nr:HU family DNA-binding protein [Bartonella sp. TP]WJW80012.1 HU family DNA-binding protein [Bartonella sp. TP]